jgi:hypothetical protein
MFGRDICDHVRCGFAFHSRIRRQNDLFHFALSQQGFELIKPQLLWADSI